MDTYAMEAPGRRVRRKHSAEFKATVIRACRQPGVSMASVALAHGLNATMLRKWVVETERGASPTGAVAMPMQPGTFVPLALPHEAAGRNGIRIELQRGNLRITLEWPRDGASECAAWMRELLR